MAAKRERARSRGDFGRIVRSHRERLGMTLNELARKIDIDQGLLSKIETGKRPAPQIVPHVHRIAAAFGFMEGSTELKELVDVAYRERFGRESSGEGAIVYVLGGGGVDQSTPVTGHRGLGEFGLRPRAEEVLGDRVQGASALPCDLSATVNASLLRAWLEQITGLLAHMGVTMTGIKRDGESFNLELRLPDGSEWRMSVSQKSRPLDAS